MILLLVCIHRGATIAASFFLVPLIRCFDGSKLESRQNKCFALSLAREGIHGGGMSLSASGILSYVSLPFKTLID